jgi:hypothetical protein
VAGEVDAVARISVETGSLDAATLVALLQTFEVLAEACVASNNTLLAKLAAEPGVSPEVTTILNEWSALNNGIHTAHALEIERLTSTINRAHRRTVQG